MRIHLALAGAHVGTTRREVTERVKGWATAQGRAVIAKKGSNQKSVTYLCASTNVKRHRDDQERPSCAFKLSVSARGETGWFVGTCNLAHTNACLQQAKPTTTQLASFLDQMAPGTACAMSGKQAAVLLKHVHAVSATPRQISRALAQRSNTQLDDWHKDISKLEALVERVNAQAHAQVSIVQQPMR